MILGQVIPNVYGFLTLKSAERKGSKHVENIMVEKLKEKGKLFKEQLQEIENEKKALFHQGLFEGYFNAKKESQPFYVETYPGENMKGEIYLTGSQKNVSDYLNSKPAGPEKNIFGASINRDNFKRTFDSDLPGTETKNLKNSFISQPYLSQAFRANGDELTFNIKGKDEEPIPVRIVQSKIETVREFDKKYVNEKIHDLFKIPKPKIRNEMDIYKRRKGTTKINKFNASMEKIKGSEFELFEEKTLDLDI